MKKRTEEEGRRLVSDYVGSGKTQREFEIDSGVKQCVLQYWIRRVRSMEVDDGKERFVEIALPDSGGDLMRVEFGDLKMTFSQLPDTKWFCDFIAAFTG